MTNQLRYDEKRFCKEVASRWSSSESELLEWQEEVHNVTAILADGVRTQSISSIEVFEFIEAILINQDYASEIENALAISFIEFQELEELGLKDIDSPLLIDIMKKQYERWQNIV